MLNRIRSLITNDRGQSMVTGLAAAAIAATAVVGTTTLGTYLVRQSRRAQTLNRLVVVRGQVEAALLDKSQYQKSSEDGSNARDAQIVSMARGDVGAAKGFTYMNGTSVVAVAGQRVGYDIDGVSYYPDDGTHALYADVDISCTASGCDAAYRVVARPEKGEPTPAALGAPVQRGSDGGYDAEKFAFDTPDYNLRLSYDYFQQKQFPSVCRAGADVLITGLIRTSGAVHCAATNVTACPDYQVADGVRAIKTGPAPSDPYALEMTCHPYGQVQCPPDYVLQTFDFVQLDGGPNSGGGVKSNLGGTCVYRWKNDVPWQDTWPVRSTSTGSTISMKTCNTDVYDAQGAGGCQVVVESNPGVSCPYECGSFMNPQTCYRTAYSSASITGQSIDPNTNVATCTMQIQDDCGSTMTAHSSWASQCTVKELGRNASLKKPPVGGHL